MRHLFFFALFLLVTVKGYTQSQEVDPRVAEYLGMSKSTNSNKPNENLVGYYNYVVRYGYKVMQADATKSAPYPLLSTVLPYQAGEDLSRINILSITQKRRFEEHLVYKVDGTSSILVIFSAKDMVRKYNEFKKKQK